LRGGDLFALACRSNSCWQPETGCPLRRNGQHRESLRGRPWNPGRSEPQISDHSPPLRGGPPVNLISAEGAVQPRGSSGKSSHSQVGHQCAVVVGTYPWVMQPFSKTEAILHSLPGSARSWATRARFNLPFRCRPPALSTRNVAVLGRNGWLSLHCPNRALPGKPTQAGSHSFRYCGLTGRGRDANSGIVTLKMHGRGSPGL
jgi:hypothetical protein